MTHEMRADFFVQEYDDGGGRDTFYEECPRFKHRMPLPRCKAGGKEIFVNSIYTEQNAGGRVWVRISNEEDGVGMSIDDAVAKCRTYAWVRQQLGLPALPAM